MEHTYFFTSMEWEAIGTYYDLEGKAFGVKSEVKILRTPKKWTMRGYMEVAFVRPVRFIHDYVITPTNSPTTLRWRSGKSSLGALKGTFEIVGDTILSLYASRDGNYSGMETLVQMDEYTYQNVGVSFQNGGKLSSWRVVLRAKPLQNQAEEKNEMKL